MCTACAEQADYANWSANLLSALSELDSIILLVKGLTPYESSDLIQYGAVSEAAQQGLGRSRGWVAGNLKDRVGCGVDHCSQPHPEVKDNARRSSPYPPESNPHLQVLIRTGPPQSHAEPTPKTPRDQENAWQSNDGRRLGSTMLDHLTRSAKLPGLMTVDISVAIKLMPVAGHGMALSSDEKSRELTRLSDGYQPIHSMITMYRKTIR